MINNIKVGERPLTQEERQQLLSMANDPDKLNKQGRISWKDVAKALSIHNKRALYDRLANYWKFKPWTGNTDKEEGALALAMNEQLEDGYAKHSLKAIVESHGGCAYQRTG